MSSESCKICPLIVPACPDCGTGRSCIITAQSCDTCAGVSCLDNAQVSAGTYTIGSFGVPGPVSTINPSLPGEVRTSFISSVTESATASVSNPITIQTSISGESTTASRPITIQTSIPSDTTVSSIGAPITSGASTTAASISSQVSSILSSVTSSPSPSTGAAPMLGVAGVETQGLLWLVAMIWVGVGIFGGRRTRM